MRPRRVHVPFCLLLLVTLTAPEGRAQQTNQSGFRTGVEIVEVPVTILDGKRQPVRGLRVEDFTILEDGKPRPVVTFAAVDVSTPASAPAPVASVAEPAIVGATPVTSASARTTDDGRLVVIILDRSIPFGTPTQIARLVARSVVQTMAPNDLGAVIYTGSSQHSQDVTGDPSRLLAAIGVSEPFSTDSPGVRFRDEIQRDTIEADLWTGDDVPRIIPNWTSAANACAGSACSRRLRILRTPWRVFHAE